MRTFKQLLSISILIALLYSCSSNSDNDPQIIDPEVATLDAMVATNGGVNFLGNFSKNGHDISEVGFEYALNEFFTTNKVILKSDLNSSNRINYFLATGLIENVTYYYKAYVKSSGITFYGNTLSFISNGSAIPQINSLSSDFGLLADIIEIHGKYFKDNSHQTFVDFSTVNAQILLLNDTLVRCKVPVNLTTVVNPVRIRIDNRSDSYTSFTLHQPTIESISPINATFRDELTITGDNFDFEITRNKVYFGNVEASITFVDKNTIKVIVPDDIESSSVPIKVTSQLQEVVYSENFQLIPPVINSIPNQVYANQDITITGTNFHPIKEKNIVVIEDIETTILNGTVDNLEIKMPLGPFPRRKAKVKIKLLDLVIEHQVDIFILDSWVMVSNDLPFRFVRSMGGAVTANNNAFVLAPSREILNSTYYLWSFDAQNMSWTKKDLPFNIGTNESGGVLESNGIYLYLYLPNSGNDFWEYDPNTDVWTKKTSFIGNRRAGATHFTINGDVYIGLGKDFIPYIPISYKDLYKYDTSNDSWTQLSDVPFGPYEQNGRVYTASFVIQGIGYFTGGALTTGDTDCWSYNPASDVWARIAVFETPRLYTSAFSLNGLGYVSGGTSVGGSNRKDCWTYNPVNNSWTQIDDVGHIERGEHFSFTLNGKAYIGGGGIYSGGSNGYDFYEFIP